MKTAIIAVFMFALACFTLGWGIDRKPQEVASVSASIVPYVIGAFALLADFALIIIYALWRLLA